MNLLNTFKHGIQHGSLFLKKHAPTILTALGVGSAVSSVVLAIKATPKAVILIEERKKKEEKDKLTALETVDTCWKVYTPTALTLIMAIACPIGANCLNVGKQAALLGVCSAQGEFIKDYKKKVIDTIGPDKEKDIQKQIDQEKVLGNNQIINFTPIRPEEFPCLDDMTGQVFSSNRDKIEKVVLTVRDIIHSSMEISKNDYLELMGERIVDDGYEWGWNETTGFELDISTCEVNNMPCYVVHYEVKPVYRFNYYS